MIVQGATNPDEFYVHKPGLNVGKSAVVRRTLGSKTMKMVYCNELSQQQTVKIVEVDKAEQLLFSITSAEAEQLARQALLIEKHYGRPMDIGWAKDGRDGQLYILQARPETIKSRSNKQKLERYTLKSRSKILSKGKKIIVIGKRKFCNFLILLASQAGFEPATCPLGGAKD